MRRRRRASSPSPRRKPASSSSSSSWINTHRKAPDTGKAIWRNASTGELRVKRMATRNGVRVATYVKLPSAAAKPKAKPKAKGTANVIFESGHPTSTTPDSPATSKYIISDFRDGLLRPIPF